MHTVMLPVAHRCSTHLHHSVLTTVDCFGVAQTGKAPAILFSLPGNQSELLSLDSKEITQLVRGQPFWSPACRSLPEQPLIHSLLWNVCGNMWSHGNM